MNKTRLLLLIFLIVSVSVSLTGCSFLSTTSLTILQHHLEKSIDDEGNLTAVILGVALNDGSARLEYAEIEGSFYSQGGTLLARGFAKTSLEEEEEFRTLDPGEIWDFTIPYPESPSEAAYPSLKVLECTFVKNYPTETKLVGSAQNDGNVTLAFVKLTGYFCDISGKEIIPTGTATTTDLTVGEVWNFTIYFPSSDLDKPEGGYVKIENPDEDLQPAEMDEDVDHATVEVGRLRGSTLMP